MSFNPSAELKKSFDLASLRHFAKKHLRGEDWQVVQKVMKTFDDNRRYERRDYKLNYETRLNAARTKLIDKAGAKTKSFKHRWFGNDQFSATAINKQADRMVRSSHLKAMEFLDAEEQQTLSRLCDLVKPNRALKQKTKQDFEKAVDRRQTPERRKRRRIMD